VPLHASFEPTAVYPGTSPPIHESLRSGGRPGGQFCLPFTGFEVAPPAAELPVPRAQAILGCFQLLFAAGDLLSPLRQLLLDPGGEHGRALTAYPAYPAYPAEDA
jgi:hypothetical protein